VKFRFLEAASRRHVLRALNSRSGFEPHWQQRSEKPTTEEDDFGILSGGAMIVPAFFGEAGLLRIAVVRAPSLENWQPLAGAPACKDGGPRTVRTDRA